MKYVSALAAAAVLMGTGAVSAADLARKAPAAAEYVKVCDAYGAGYFYIPGSETCLRIGGFVRAEFRALTQSRENIALPAVYGWSPRNQRAIATRARVNLTIDARTNTEMGLLRSFVDIWITQNTAQATTETSLRKAFVQFGGLTAGRAQSFFDFFTAGIGVTDSFQLASAAFSEVNLIAYTFGFGNGISASLSLEDAGTSNEPASSLTAGFRRMNGPYGGVKTPDLVANVAIKQAWGSAQIMGVLHDDNGNAAVNESKLGYAVGGGVKVLVPMLGAGDIVGLQAAWGKGALGYVAAGVWTANTPFQDFEFTGGQLLQSTAWSVAGGYNHNWTKTLSSSIGGSYLRYDAPTGSAFADFDQIDLQGSMRWKPAAGPSFTAALEYRRIDRAVLPDGDGLVAFFRIQRDF